MTTRLAQLETLVVSLQERVAQLELRPDPHGALAELEGRVAQLEREPPGDFIAPNVHSINNKGEVE
jgi:hypothetical protein